MLGNSANLLDVLLDVVGNEGAVSTHPALKIDKMVIVANATNALGDLLALLSQALVFTVGRFELVLGLLQAPRRLWGGAPDRAWGVRHPWFVSTFAPD